jgi:hypothetical protein
MAGDSFSSLKLKRREKIIFSEEVLWETALARSHKNDFVQLSENK